MMGLSININSMVGVTQASTGAVPTSSAGLNYSNVDFRQMLAQLSKGGATAKEGIGESLKLGISPAMMAPASATSIDEKRVEDLLKKGELSLNDGMALMQTMHASSLRVLLASHVANSVTQSVQQLTTRMA